MNRIKLWPHATLLVLAFAAIAGIAAAVWMKYGRSAEAKDLPNAARIERVDGQVGVNQSLDNSTSPQWVAATPNTPVTVGDRIYTRENSRSQIAFTGRNFATIESNTALDVLDLSSQRTQVALRNGSGLFEVGSLGSSELFEVATPCGAVDLEKPGVYQVAIDDNGNAVATAFSGAAQIVGQAGAGRIERGENLTISCEGGPQAVVSRVDPDRAGSVLDSYYRTRYPRQYDGRYRNYDTYTNDPYYYDPSRRYVSYNYVSDYIPGVEDLDDYGDWQYVNDYGYCWHPRVDNGWAPYQSGLWSMDYPYGLTWVSNEPWGYAPYHYGRWAYASNEWFWVPDSVRSYPNYSPALVAFIPFNDTSIGWVALGPSDPYVPRYYDTNWRPVYSGRRDVVLDRIVNINVPGALTVVPFQQFGRTIDPRIVTRVDPRTIAGRRAVLDPLGVDTLRRAAFVTRENRQRIDVPPAVAQRILNRPVIASAMPPASPLRRDLARTLRVEPVTDRARSQRLQIADQREPGLRRAENGAPTGPQPNLAAEQARERQMADLARQASRGDRNARQQMQDLRRQQFEQQRADRVNAQQAQGERVRQQMQQQQNQRDALRQQQVQRESARQQMMTNQQQRQEQIQSQRQQRQMEMPRAPNARRSNQQQTLRSPQAPQRVERRPPPQYRAPTQPGVIAPQPQQQMRQPRPQTAPRAAPQEMRQQRQPQPQQMRQPPVQQPAPRAAPQEMHQQRQAQPPQAPPKQQQQPRPPEQQKGRGKKP